MEFLCRAFEDVVLSLWRVNHSQYVIAHCIFAISSDGYFGSCIDEGRSKMW